MKIIFAIYGSERFTKMNYENYINKSGFSGTDAQIIEFVKRLKENGHNAKIYIPNVDYENDYVINKIDCYEDIEIVIFYNDLFVVPIIDLLNKVSLDCRIVYYGQCILRNETIETLKCFKKRSIIGVSDYVRNYYGNAIKGIPYKTINNALNPDIYDNNEIDYDCKRGNVVFFASFGRGGVEAYKVFKKYQLRNPDAKFYIASYFPRDSFLTIPDESVEVLGSLSKIELKKLLLKCDYFIYPLTNPNGLIHHDTYGNVILEALACGVSVISWNVACIPEVYGRWVFKLKPLPYPGYKPFGGFSEINISMKSDAAIDMFANEMFKIDRIDKFKRQHKIEARNWAISKDKTWDNAYDKFAEFLEIKNIDK